MRDVKFVITALIHSVGECRLTDNNDEMFIRPATVVPVVDIIGEIELTPEETARVRLMAIHQLTIIVAKMCEPKGMEIEATAPINMNPSSGEKN